MKPEFLNARLTLFSDEGPKRFARFSIVRERGWIGLEHRDGLATGFTAGLGEEEGTVVVPYAHLSWDFYLELRRLVSFAWSCSVNPQKRRCTDILPLLRMMIREKWAKATEYGTVLDKLALKNGLGKGVK